MQAIEITTSLRAPLNSNFAAMINHFDFSLRQFDWNYYYSRIYGTKSLFDSKYYAHQIVHPALFLFTTFNLYLNSG